MLRLTIYKPPISKAPTITISATGIITFGSKIVGEHYFNLLFELCRVDIATNNSKKEIDTALYLIPSNDSSEGTSALTVDRRGTFIRLPLESYLKRFDIVYPATVDCEIIYYQGSPVLKLHTTKILPGTPAAQKALPHISDNPKITEENLTGAGIPRKLAQDILKNKRAKEVPKKVSTSKINPQKGKNNTLMMRSKKPGRPSKKGIKNKIGKN